jgi:zinc finger CCHC domain-containing protein 9
MTRVTSFGRKRTYVDSGIGSQVDPDATEQPQQEAKDELKVEGAVEETIAPPPKKKRKRTKMSKRDGNAATKAAMEGVDNADSKGVGEEDQDREEKSEEVLSESAPPKPTLSKSAKKKKREKERKIQSTCSRLIPPRVAPYLRNNLVLSASENRRQKRIDEKMAGTICFACRAKGHAAKDCPVTKRMANGEGNSAKSKGVVGICYR